MNAQDGAEKVTTRQFERKFTYNNTVVLTLSMEYPKLDFPGCPAASAMINRCIRAQTDRFYHYVSSVLYRQAVNAYRASQSGEPPFHPYDAAMKYQITYCDNCYLSFYRDCYEFTGGAHGNTIRRSDTWDLKTGKNLPVGCFFTSRTNYRQVLREEILRQADETMRQCPDAYFEDYRKLICRYFDPKNYYLVPGGIAVYFQLYEVAPYAAGFVSFSVPETMLDCPPECAS